MPCINSNIRCDVRSCAHNADGKNCKLEQIKITTDCTDCTCCDNYSYNDQAEV